MLEIICQKCQTVHRYEVSDNCSKCESSFHDVINPLPPKRPYKLIAAVLGVTFTGGIITDNLIFDTDNNVQANAEEIYVLYNGMQTCVQQKAQMSTKTLDRTAYSAFAKRCSETIARK